MRILAITNLYPPFYLGGYELICYHVLGALHARGHEIAVLTSDHGIVTADNAATVNDRKRDRGLRRFTQIKIPSHDPRPSAKSAVQKLANRDIRCDDVSAASAVHEVPQENIDRAQQRTRNQEPATISVERSLKIHGFYGHPWLSIRKLRYLERHNNDTLRRAIGRHRPDLVYVWNMGGLSKSMLLTLQGLNIPTGFYLSDHWIARGLNSDVWLRWWNRPDAQPLHRIVRLMLAKLGFRRSWQAIAPTHPASHVRFQRIYFCSRALRDSAVAAGFRVEHAAIIHCPVDVQQFHGSPKPADHPVEKLLYAGRLSPDKGIMTALKTMGLLQGKFHGSLTLCGRGDDDYVFQLKRFASAHRLPVAFDSASMDRMPEIYRAFDALLFTSEWDEPFALTPLEAMASGLPVIATTTGGSAELFRHRENCLTYSAGNPEDLASRILELTADSALRLRIATTGYCAVRERYAEPIIVDQIEDYLEETLRCWLPSTLPAYDP